MNFTFMHFGAGLIRQARLLPLIESIEAYRRNLLRILVYHRIGDPGAESGLLDPSLLSAIPKQFEQQMRFLCEHYRLLSIRDLLQAIETNEPLPPKSVMVTFDDGYHDFLETAWPILERYQVPSLMFLPTGFLSPENQLFWWDRLYQGICKTDCKKLSLPTSGDYPLENKIQRWDTFIELKRQISRMDFHYAIQRVDQIMETLDVTPETAGLLMSWNDARFLNEQGCYLAPHTRNHQILSRIPLENARQEIRYSCKDIRREIGTFWPVMAYPSGHFQDLNDDLLPILNKEGFKLAMTSIPGINVMPRVDLLRMKRIDLSPRLIISEFQLVLTGVYHFYCVFQNMFSS